MIEIETYRGVVYPWHCDFNEHMNVQHYVGKFDEATWHFFGHLTITASFLRKNKKGLVAVEQHLTYYKELLAGDLIVIKTQLLELKPKSITFLHKMYNSENEELAAQGKMTGVYIDKTTRKSDLLPDFVFKKARTLQKSK